VNLNLTNGEPEMNLNPTSLVGINTAWAKRVSSAFRGLGSRVQKGFKTDFDPMTPASNEETQRGSFSAY
jgi:hypothetical protein